MFQSDDNLLSLKSLQFLCLLNDKYVVLKDKETNKTVQVTKAKYDEILSSCLKLAQDKTKDNTSLIKN